MRLKEKRPPDSLYDALGREHDLVLQRAAAVATDRQSKKAHRQIRQTMRAAGLGRLGNAVGVTTSLDKGRREGTNHYGAIYAKGGDDSLAGAALRIYSRGGTIRPKKGKWLWFQTKAIARRLGGRRSTPERYAAAGNPLGPLKFRRVSRTLAILYVENVMVNPKGRARLPGKRPRSAPQRRVTVFYGIPYTRRAKRFDERIIIRQATREVPEEIAKEIRRHLKGRVQQR